MRRLSAGFVVASFTGLSVIPVPTAPGVRLEGVTSAASAWTASDLWLTPAPLSTPELGRAVRALADGDHSYALEAFRQAASHPVIGQYARLYQGRTELALARVEAAIASARSVLASPTSRVVREEALWLLADATERAEQWSEATRTLTALTELPARDQAAAFLRRGRAAFKADQPGEAAQSFTTLYYDFPLAPESEDAEAELKRHFHWPPATDSFERAERRAERLYEGRRFDVARRGYLALAAAPHAPDGARLRLTLRIAQCDVQVGRYSAARDALRNYLATATDRLDEAGYAYLGALRGLRRGAEFTKEVRAFVAAHPSSPLAEAALNDLATYHILADEDEAALQVFGEMLRTYPRGAFAERAAWKAGWAAFRAGDYSGAIALFEPAAAAFPRSDYRPSWLYWAARAHERLGHVEQTAVGYRRTIDAYRNSYYGRQAEAALARRAAGPVLASARPSGPNVGLAAGDVDATSTSRLTLMPAAPPANAPVIQALLAAELYDEAILEVRSAQSTAPSALLDATLAYALNRKGQLRPAITAMRRAYPQFMADGGNQLPAELLRVIFPVDYWDLIQHYAVQRRLDPYLMAALIAQESTFQHDIRSRANAWGLMQILPATGRRVALSVGVRGFTTAKLKDPDVNIRIGMKFFQDLLARFDGDVVSALAAYNAGENRVIRWRAERPGLDRDEFIDDIPFPETQNYVKRILGTADDYRALYPTGGPS